jgi:hypothetical protein
MYLGIDMNYFTCYLLQYFATHNKFDNYILNWHIEQAMVRYSKVKKHLQSLRIISLFIIESILVPWGKTMWVIKDTISLPSGSGEINRWILNLNLFGTLMISKKNCSNKAT